MTQRISEPVFIGIGHKKQQGKDKFADMLQENLTELGFVAVRRSFATGVKRLAEDLFGLTVRQCWGDDNDKATLTKVRGCDMGLPSTALLTARQVLQQVGTDLRECWPGVWTRPVLDEVYEPPTDFVIISDLRFVDEASAIHERGGQVIRISRPHTDSDPHYSENALNGWKWWDASIWNDGTLAELSRVAGNFADMLAEHGKVNTLPETERVVHCHAGPGYDEHLPNPQYTLG